MSPQGIVETQWGALRHLQCIAVRTAVEILASAPRVHFFCEPLRLLFFVLSVGA
jgi:hypothetical protein